MSGVPENQMFDFAPNASQPILTSQERRKMLLKEYRKKWLQKPESQEKVRLINCKANHKYRINRSLEEKAIDRQYQQNWYQNNKEHVKAVQKEFLAKPETKVYRSQYMRDYRKSDPARKDAHQKLTYAVKRGRVTKPDYCQQCGEKGWLHGHHPDYSEPFNVQWLCVSCHKSVHHLRL